MLIRSSILILLAMAVLTACSNTANSQDAEAAETAKTAQTAVGPTTRLKGTVTNPPGEFVNVYLPAGWGYQLLTQVPLTPTEGSENVYAFDEVVTVPAPGVYGIGFSEQNKADLLLGADSVLSLTMQDGSQVMGKTSVAEAPANMRYINYNNAVNQLQMSQQQINQQLQAAQAGQGQVDANALMRQRDSLMREQSNLQQSMANTQGITAQIARLQMYDNFDPQNPAHQQYQNQVNYFANTFLTDEMLLDTSLAYFPMYYNRVQHYTMQLAQFGVPLDQLVKLLEAKQQVAPLNSRNEQLFLLGVMGGAANSRSNDLYATFGKKFLERYPDHPMAEKIETDLKSIGGALMGAEAPEIALPNPEGDTLRLSELRGKYVLVDFWASWCGPCRRENPNVVRLYNEYNDDGFEVFSVSLDRQGKKDNWLYAIQKDGLKWPYHVSELAGWGSQVAKAYGVSSIPSTFLLDPEGNIIGKDLRGQQLEARLKEIFSESN